MNALEQRLQQLRTAGKKVFIPFLSAGDPSIEATQTLIADLAAEGASVVEVGFPFSDPIADGPVIQASYSRALERGLHVDGVFQCIHRSRHTGVPIVGMASYSLIHRRRVSGFLTHAVESGLSGLIVPDLPAEEAGDLSKQASESGLSLILLVTPTTPPERAERIVRQSTGFVYVVSVAGITGERDRLPDELLGQLRQLRRMTDLPLCVGFGVSRPEHVTMLRPECDGVIVGSAFVRKLEGGTDRFESARVEIRELASRLISALNPSDH